MNDHQPAGDNTHRTGKAMLTIAWIIGLALLTWFFADIEESQFNPNRSVASSIGGGRVELVLQQNRWGHYLASGTINSEEVTFLLDTGATVVSVPYHLNDKLNLPKGRPYTTMTANGNITVYSTTIAELRIGDMAFHNVRGALNPGMQSDEILLGMSALANVEMTQRGEQLILRSY